MMATSSVHREPTSRDEDLIDMSSTSDWPEHSEVDPPTPTPVDRRVHFNQDSSPPLPSNPANPFRRAAARGSPFRGRLQAPPLPPSPMPAPPPVPFPPESYYSRPPYHPSSYGYGPPGYYGGANPLVPYNNWNRFPFHGGQFPTPPMDHTSFGGPYRNASTPYNPNHPPPPASSTTDEPYSFTAENQRLKEELERSRKELEDYKTAHIRTETLAEAQENLQKAKAEVEEAAKRRLDEERQAIEKRTFEEKKLQVEREATERAITIQKEREERRIMEEHRLRMLEQETIERVTKQMAAEKERERQEAETRAQLERDIRNKLVEEQKQQEQWYLKEEQKKSDIQRQLLERIENKKRDDEDMQRYREHLKLLAENEVRERLAIERTRLDLEKLRITVGKDADELIRKSLHPSANGHTPRPIPIRNSGASFQEFSQNPNRAAGFQAESQSVFQYLKEDLSDVWGRSPMLSPTRASIRMNSPANHHLSERTERPNLPTGASFGSDLPVAGMKFQRRQSLSSPDTVYPISQPHSVFSTGNNRLREPREYRDSSPVRGKFAAQPFTGPRSSGKQTSEDETQTNAYDHPRAGDAFSEERLVELSPLIHFSSAGNSIIRSTAIEARTQTPLQSQEELTREQRHQKYQAYVETSDESDSEENAYRHRSISDTELFQEVGKEFGRDSHLRPSRRSLDRFISRPIVDEEGAEANKNVGSASANDQSTNNFNTSNTVLSTADSTASASRNCRRRRRRRREIRKTPPPNPPTPPPIHATQDSGIPLGVSVPVPRKSRKHYLVRDELEGYKPPF